MNKRLLMVLMAFVMLFTACSNANKPATTTTEAGIKDGTYTVEVEGFHGSFEVSTTIKDGKIESVVVGDNEETENIGSVAIDKIPGLIVENQTVAVDAISGSTITSDAIKKAVGEAIVQAGGNLDEFSKVVEKTAGEEIVKDADVIVIGGGGAGLAAAVSAAENGATAILIEKTAALGGNTVRAGGPYNAVDPQRQEGVPAASDLAMESVIALTEKEAVSPEHQAWMDQLKSDLDAYNSGDTTKLFDSIALHILQTYDGGDYAGQLPMIEKLVEESLPTSEWMAANGVEWKEEISTVPGGLWPRAHTPINAAGGDFIKASEAKANELGVEIILECKGNELITDETGKVVGVKAEMSDGTPVTLNAKKAVIIATGGFGANKEMRQEYDPSLGANLGTTNSPAITGDGIIMAEDVNANLVGMEYIQSLPLGDPETGALNGWMGSIGVEYYYQINKEGVRFMAEDGRRDTMTASLLQQTDAMSYVITDTNRESEGTEVNLWGDNIEELVKNGTIYRADTIEELAELIGVDAETLKKTHEDFNSYVAGGSDPEFGRKLFGDPIETAPFYASPRMPTVHHTMGGIEINLKGQALDKDGNVIPGLYAAGEVTGGIHGKNRLGGNALVDIHVFGREAGKNAALDN